jgi:hypothetical protein
VKAVSVTGTLPIAGRSVMGRAIGWRNVSRDDIKRSQSSPEHKHEGRYANVFQIGHNAFEVLIEFGQHEGGIHTRIYISPQHARILSDLLIDTLRQHEKMFHPPSKGGMESS